jgi:hypothetical protein
MDTLKSVLQRVWGSQVRPVVDRELQARGNDLVVAVNGKTAHIELKCDMQPCNNFLEVLQLMLGCRRLFGLGNVYKTTANYYLIFNYVSGYAILVARRLWASRALAKARNSLTDNGKLHAAMNMVPSEPAWRVERVGIGKAVKNVGLVGGCIADNIYCHVFSLESILPQEPQARARFLAALYHGTKEPTATQVAERLKIWEERGKQDFKAMKETLEKVGSGMKPLSDLETVLLDCVRHEQSTDSLQFFAREFLREAEKQLVTNWPFDFQWDADKPFTVESEDAFNVFKKRVTAVPPPRLALNPRK